MATYVKEESRGNTLHLLKLDRLIDNQTVYLDATTKIDEAIKDDMASGHNNTGPNTSIEIEKARAYADYVAGHASMSNLHQFNGKGYFLFSDKDELERA